MYATKLVTNFVKKYSFIAAKNKKRQLSLFIKTKSSFLTLNTISKVLYTLII